MPAEGARVFSERLGAVLRSNGGRQNMDAGRPARPGLHDNRALSVHLERRLATAIRAEVDAMVGSL